MTQLAGQVAWITGAGSGIGEAAAIALAAAGATLVLTGRRAGHLETVAGRVKEAGGQAHVQAGDLMEPDTSARIGGWIDQSLGRLDILVNNAGLNTPRRYWADVEVADVDQVVGANVSAAFYCVIAALPLMRRGGGCMIHTASWAGRFVSPLSGPAYSAAKHAAVAMSHSINMEEHVNGIRSTALCPGEVATPILEKRPVPVSAEDRARMLQSEDVGDLIRYIACLPPHVCINEVLISPTWNRGYVGSTRRL